MKNALRDKHAQMDKMILQKAQLELDEEKRQRDVLKAKTMAAKETRDAMMHEARVRRERDFKAQRAQELVEVEQLQKELESEKEAKVKKKQ